MTSWEGLGGHKCPVRHREWARKGMGKELVQLFIFPICLQPWHRRGWLVGGMTDPYSHMFIGHSSLYVRDPSFFNCRHQEGTGRLLSLKHIPSVSVFPRSLFKQHQQQGQWHTITQKQSSPDAFSFLVLSLAASREPW